MAITKRAKPADADQFSNDDVAGGSARTGTERMIALLRGALARQAA